MTNLDWFTRVRFINKKTNSADYSFKGSPNQAPDHLTPWFTLYSQKQHQNPNQYPQTLLFGHWAALGIYIKKHLVALDSGCIWGKSLSAFRLDDGILFQQPTLETPWTPKS